MRLINPPIMPHDTPRLHLLSGVVRRVMVATVDGLHPWKEETLKIGHAATSVELMATKRGIGESEIRILEDALSQMLKEVPAEVGKALWQTAFETENAIFFEHPALTMTQLPYFADYEWKPSGVPNHPWNLISIRDGSKGCFVFLVDGEAHYHYSGQEDFPGGTLEIFGKVNDPKRPS